MSVRSGARGRAKKTTLRERDHGCCHYCGAYCPDFGGVDHVVPRSRAGVNANWNLVWSCQPCNEEKGDALPTCECSFCAEAVWIWARQVLSG